jgi:hypothetical protein
LELQKLVYLVVAALPQVQPHLTFLVLFPYPPVFPKFILRARGVLAIPATQVIPATQATRGLTALAGLAVMAHILPHKRREFFAGCVQHREEMVLPGGVGLAAAAHL